MGLYGSPQLGPYVVNSKPIKKVKEEGHKPQKDGWIWAVMVIMDIVVIAFGITSATGIFMLLALDSIVLFVVSILSAVINLIHRRKIGYDIKFIFISLAAVIIFTALTATKI